MKKYILVVAVATLAFGAATDALAGPPVKVPLGPIQVLGDFVADCGDFDVVEDFIVEGHTILYFDDDGILIRVNQHAKFMEAIYYNSNHPDVYVMGGPGEVTHNDVSFADSKWAVAGMDFKVTLPGYGVIFHQVGRLIIDLVTFDVLFQAGPNDFFEPDAAAAICAALTP